MGVAAIFKKELRAIFASPVAYVVMVVFLALSGYFFWGFLARFTFYSLQASMNPALGGGLNVMEFVLGPLFHNMSIVMLLMMPLFTMRLFAEERKTGTLELLLTYPVRDGAILLGKFLAVVVLLFCMLGLTVTYPLLLLAFTTPEPLPILAGYLGLILVGTAFLSVGLLASALTENQIVAGSVAFGALLLVWVIGWSAEVAGGTVGRVLGHLSFLNHFEAFARGVVDTKDLIYYFNVTGVFLFLTLKAVEARRWRA
ncbi:MAG: ABC transporter permease subunit [candidate division NC10 bacterium]|nr:ABC transporter permease subunit [candidate division NC10 bacterium]MBI4391927.1 ABC transporter permease subunit [candidate division NC10 bacterium]